MTEHHPHNGRKSIKIERLLRLAGLPVPEKRGLRSVDVTGICTDSRHARPGFVFVAMQGLLTDGLAFAEEAVARGAVAVVTEKKVATRHALPMLHVPDARLAAALLAAAYYDFPSARLQAIGVTGTNGKTSTVHMATAILRAGGRRTGMLGTIQYEIGERLIPSSRTTPPPVELQQFLAEMVSVGCDAVAMEISSHALVQQRSAGIDFDVGVFTNLSHDHLDYHADMRAYLAAKQRLFEGLGHGGKKATAVINLDDEHGTDIAACCAPRVQRLGYGFGAAADVQGTVTGGEQGTELLQIRTPWGTAEIPAAALRGQFNLYNALAALAACGSLGIDPGLAAEALTAMPPVRGRMQHVDNPLGLRIVIDYAHTPDALENVLRSLRGSCQGRLIAVFGCGGDRDRDKRPAMGAVAARWADLTVLTSDNPRSEPPADICAAIRAGMPASAGVRVLIDREEAIVDALAAARRGDTVLIAGKGHETCQELANTIRPFDDCRVVHAWLAKT